MLSIDLHLQFQSGLGVALGFAIFWGAIPYPQYVCRKKWQGSAFLPFSPSVWCRFTAKSGILFSTSRCATFPGSVFQVLFSDSPSVWTTSEKEEKLCCLSDKNEEVAAQLIFGILHFAFIPVLRSRSHIHKVAQSEPSPSRQDPTSKASFSSVPSDEKRNEHKPSIAASQLNINKLPPQ